MTKVKVRGGFFALLVAFVTVLATLSGGGSAGAQTAADKDKVDQQKKAAQKQVDTASAEEERLLGLIDESTARRRELDAKVASFDGQIASVQAKVDAAQSRLSALETQQREVEGRLAESTAALGAAKQELARQAIAAYTGQSEAANYAAMLLHSADMGDLASKRSYMRAVVGSQSDAIAHAEHLKDEVADLGKQVEASKAQAQSQRDVVAAQRASLQVSRDAQAGARAEVQSEIAKNDKLRGEVLSRKEEFETQVENLERESAAISETLRRRAAEAAAAAAAAAAKPSSGDATLAPSASGAVPSKAPGRLQLPVPGAPVTSPYGPRVHPIYGTVRMHTGIDYGADTGTPIHAAADGVVVSAGWYGGYGNATIIDHGGGLATLYGHQSAMLVSAGQKVTAGQVIGRVGCTGDCTGPHVHFEVRVDGDPVNPLGYL